jgi:hypothetical protein
VLSASDTGAPLALRALGFDAAGLTAIRDGTTKYSGPVVECFDVQPRELARMNGSKQRKISAASRTST